MNVVKFEGSQCNRIKSYLDSYLNNELLVEVKHEVLRHIETCHSCSRSLEDRSRIKIQLKRNVIREFAPLALRERIRSDLRRARGFQSNISLLIAAFVAGLVIAESFS